ncbi:MAG: glycosyltransferase family 2 protein [Candidatus Edwardsbacteria bacterium]|nr:glycosyltransferase family 2 protein [Candidatus Edwardsbacteria bacterium]
MKLSATIITKNEERNIVRCLQSLDFADEIVVVDSESSDQTVAMARQFTPHVYVNPWPGHKQQKNFAIDKTTGEWILSLDADEVVTPELRAEILSEKAKWFRNIDGYYIARKSFFLDRWIAHCGWYPDYHLRIFKKEKGRFGGLNPHDIVEMQGTTARFKHPMLHFTYPTLDAYLARLNSYTSIAARELAGRGKRFRLRQVTLSPLATFLKMYLLKLGILDGREGLLLSVLSGYYVFVKYLKLWEISLERAKP